jgi:Fic family protein
MACPHFLNFQPTERPSWRMIRDQNDTIPKISEMITQILQYENTWRRKENTNQYSAVKKHMYLEFLYQIQIGEEIGVDGRDNFADIINNEENFEDGTNSSQDSLPSSQDAEDLFNKKNIDTRSAKITETINLLRGYRHLKKVLKHNDTQNEERSSYLGILDVEVCINKCHEILMKDVMTKDKTVPGKFSVLMRYTEFNGEKYYYPHYETEDVAHEAVQAIVDQYNKMLYEISNDKSERNKLENSFKCASVLLFGFLTLHPFSDGNGRLARLLCSHCLNMFSPFPTAIYNVFSPSTRDDYITAIVNARTNLELSSDKLFSDARGEAMLILEQKPADLCSLIIESNWFTWRRFLRNIGEDIPMLDFEMAD